ncbi:hypothetical protein IDJ77_22330 [Mucilaginibacter sp. ZT4R22]|uniref:Uncharacterized protein n=1 Tax=Mucilaginibacter pankratovii TaxID=2772110 RepID=A0ABR7WWA8_9SPHI|nr:hypothetical protein [Mucilaginibacter pankratovii]MBD1366568.1 hypothetical protein [Mucilaginibacter pankratovii]
MKEQFKSSAFILLAVAALSFNACKSGLSSGDIAGTYVNDAQSEASIAHDTLVVEKAGDDNYLLHRKTGFRLVVNGKPGKYLYETEEWTAVADPKTGVLTESRKGKVIKFPDSHSMTVGKRLYRRLN